MTIYLIGFMGTGKSTIARCLCSKYGMEIVEMDETIEEQQGMPITEIFATRGEAYFRSLETALLAECGKGDVVVSCGGGVAMREENVAIMRKHGKVVLLSASPAEIFERVCYSTNRPLLNKNMSEEYIAELLEKRRPFYEAAADVTVVTDGKTPEEIAEEIGQQIL